MYDNRTIATRKILLLVQLPQRIFYIYQFKHCAGESLKKSRKPIVDIFLIKKKCAASYKSINYGSDILTKKTYFFL